MRFDSRSFLVLFGFVYNLVCIKLLRKNCCNLYDLNRPVYESEPLRRRPMTHRAIRVFKYTYDIISYTRAHPDSSIAATRSGVYFTCNFPLFSPRQPSTLCRLFFLSISFTTIVIIKILYYTIIL